jgi:hypothetical protein
MKTLYQSRFGSATEDYILALAGEIDQVAFPWFAGSRRSSTFIHTFLLFESFFSFELSGHALADEILAFS